MPWPATDRFDVRRAPGSFALVQDLLNTVAGNREPLPDLLAGLDSAQAWLDGGVAAWSEARGQEVAAVTLTARDLAPLRELRAQLHAVAAGTDDDSRSDTPLDGELSIPVTL